MDFLGISPLELLAILIIVFLVMGPQDLVKIGGTLGRGLRKFRESDTWRVMQDATRQLRQLPETLVRQAGLDELEKMQSELRDELKEQKAALDDIDKQLSAWTRNPAPLSQKTKVEKPTEPPASEGE
jgi:Sec-independent protein translocase protein TatA